jgi:hypothetical protein
MFSFQTTHLFSYAVNLRSPPQAIGPVPEGIRVNFHIEGGAVTGPRLQGRVLAVGQDAFLLRRDGMGVLQVQATIETHDGALIDVTYPGLGDLGEDAYDKFLRGELPQTVALRTSPSMRSAHPDYQWVNRVFCFGVGEVDLARCVVRYDVHAVV